MLDAGSGLFRVEKLLESEEISVLLSHTHLDHVFGLTFFLDFVAVTPLKTVHVYGEKAKLEILRKHLFHELLFPVMPSIQWHPIDDYGQRFKVNGTECRWIPLEHPGGSVGYRIELEGHSLAYITDTTATRHASYWEEIQGVDWLIHECNFSDEWIDLAIKTGHSWTSAVLDNACRAKINRLILTHINPLANQQDPLGLEAIRQRGEVAIPSKLIIAEDSMVIDLASL